MKQIELENFELQNIVKTLYPFDIVQMNDSQFSHSNTKRCHVDRYFNNGHRSKVDQKITDQLFNNK